MVSSVSDLIKYHSNLSCNPFLFTFSYYLFTFIFFFTNWLAPFYVLFTRFHSKICLILVLQVNLFLILGLSLCNVIFSNNFSSKKNYKIAKLITINVRRNIFWPKFYFVTVWTVNDSIHWAFFIVFLTKNCFYFSLGSFLYDFIKFFFANFLL